MWTKHRIPIQQLECNSTFSWNFHTPLKSWGDFLILCCRCKYLNTTMIRKRQYEMLIQTPADRQGWQARCFALWDKNVTFSIPWERKKKNPILWPTYLSYWHLYSLSDKPQSTPCALPGVSAWNNSPEQRIPHTSDSLSVVSLPQLKGYEHLH